MGDQHWHKEEDRSTDKTQGVGTDEKKLPEVERFLDLHTAGCVCHELKAFLSSRPSEHELFGFPKGSKPFVEATLRLEVIEQKPCTSCGTFSHATASSGQGLQIWVQVGKAGEWLLVADTPPDPMARARGPVPAADAQECQTCQEAEERARKKRATQAAKEQGRRHTDLPKPAAVGSGPDLFSTTRDSRFVVLCPEESLQTSFYGEDDLPRHHRIHNGQFLLRLVVWDSRVLATEKFSRAMVASFAQQAMLSFQYDPGIFSDRDGGDADVKKYQIMLQLYRDRFEKHNRESGATGLKSAWQNAKTFYSDQQADRTVDDSIFEAMFGAEPREPGEACGIEDTGAAKAHRWALHNFQFAHEGGWDELEHALSSMATEIDADESKWIDLVELTGKQGSGTHFLCGLLTLVFFY
jgi:hypothetical protein